MGQITTTFLESMCLTWLLIMHILSELIVIKSELSHVDGPHGN